MTKARRSAEEANLISHCKGMWVQVVELCRHIEFADGEMPGLGLRGEMDVAVGEMARVLGRVDVAG